MATRSLTRMYLNFRDVSNASGSISPKKVDHKTGRGLRNNKSVGFFQFIQVCVNLSSYINNDGCLLNILRVYICLKTFYNASICSVDTSGRHRKLGNRRGRFQTHVSKWLKTLLQILLTICLLYLNCRFLTLTSSMFRMILWHWFQMKIWSMVSHLY